MSEAVEFPPTLNSIPVALRNDMATEIIAFARSVGASGDIPPSVAMRLLGSILGRYQDHRAEGDRAYVKYRDAMLDQAIRQIAALDPRVTGAMRMSASGRGET